MQDLNALFDLQNLLVDAISAQEQFERIAKELMVNYGILQKDMPSISNSTRMVDVEYRFLEIEFYYVSENHKDIKANGSHNTGNLMEAAHAFGMINEEQGEYLVFSGNN